MSIIIINFNNLLHYHIISQILQRPNLNELNYKKYTENLICFFFYNSIGLGFGNLICLIVVPNSLGLNGAELP